MMMCPARTCAPRLISRLAPPRSALHSDTGGGIVEVRTYTAHPGSSSSYVELAAAAADTRRKHCKDGWKLFLSAETGSGSLSDFIHIYTYDSLQHRQEVRAQMARDPQWQLFLEASRPCLSSQRSEIFCPAVVPHIDRSYFPSSSSSSGGGGVFEIRRYQLRPGYDSVPKLVEAFSRGLPDKLNRCSADSGKHHDAHIGLLLLTTNQPTTLCATAAG